MNEWVERFACKCPTACRTCGGSNLVLRYRGAANQIAVTCDDCGDQYALPHIRDEYRKPTNKDAIWAKEVKARDKCRCVICGSRENLQAHHIIPVANDPWNQYRYNVGNGVTLCKECHEFVHLCMRNGGGAK